MACRWHSQYINLINEQVEIDIPLANGVSKRDIKVTIKPKFISVHVNNMPVAIEGNAN